MTKPYLVRLLVDWLGVIIAAPFHVSVIEFIWDLIHEPSFGSLHLYRSLMGRPFATKIAESHFEEKRDLVIVFNRIAQKFKATVREALNIDYCLINDD